MIKFSINVSLINKDKLFQGKKGKYLNCVMIDTPNSEYGDYLICEDVSKEERDKGVKGTILGNAKIFLRRSQEKNEPKPVKEDDDGDSVPF